MDIIAQRIRLLRKTRRMTQLCLAMKLELAQETISGYEIGRIDPSLETLIKLADCLNTSVDYILGRTEDITPISYKTSMSEIENRLLCYFKLLSSKKQERAIGYIEALSEKI